MKLAEMEMHWSVKEHCICGGSQGLNCQKNAYWRLTKRRVQFDGLRKLAFQRKDKVMMSHNLSITVILLCQG